MTIFDLQQTPPSTSGQSSSLLGQVVCSFVFHRLFKYFAIEQVMFERRPFTGSVEPRTRYFRFPGNWEGIFGA